MSSLGDEITIASNGRICQIDAKPRKNTDDQSGKPFGVRLGLFRGFQLAVSAVLAVMAVSSAPHVVESCCQMVQQPAAAPAAMMAQGVLAVSAVLSAPPVVKSCYQMVQLPAAAAAMTVLAVLAEMCAPRVV